MASGLDLLEVFTPRRQCMRFEPDVVGLHLVSDALIALAYFSIPLALLYFVRRRRDLAFHWMFLLFALFIVLCGTTHVFGVVALWAPVYRLDGWVKLLTALASVGTAAALWRLIPRALALPSPDDLRAVNRELDRQREFLDAVLEHIADGVVACDPAGRLTLFNRATRAFHGLPAEPVPADDWAGQYDLYRADGTPLPTAEVPLYRALQGERVRDAEMVIAPKRGPRRTLLASGQPLANPAGERLGAVVSMRDVTDQKKAEGELRAYSARLARSNQELERFAAVASHDLQEPLRKIQAFGDRLRAECGPALGDAGRGNLDRVLAAAGRMRTLIDGLLTLSRVATKGRPFQPVDLNKVAAEVVGDLEARIADTAGRVDVGPLPTLDADPVQMRQLLQNLVGNALKFRCPGVPPVVTVAADVRPTAAGAVCRLSVADAGIGFDEQYLDRIFEMFQRLHGRSEYEGTGVGLAICRRIAERHGGTITATGNPDRGATFVVELPVQQAADGATE